MFYTTHITYRHSIKTGVRVLFWFFLRPFCHGPIHGDSTLPRQFPTVTWVFHPFLRPNTYTFCLVRRLDFEYISNYINLTFSRYEKYRWIEACADWSGKVRRKTLVTDHVSRQSRVKRPNTDHMSRQSRVKRPI